MYLQTILIFCSVCFFTGTVSQGLNARQIYLYHELIWTYDIDVIEHALKCNGINSKSINEICDRYKKSREVSAVQLNMILNLLVQVNKWGDERNVEKLCTEEVEKFSIEFDNLDLDNNGRLNKEEYNNLIDYLIEKELKVDEDNKINPKGSVDVFEMDIIDENKNYFDLSDVLLKVIQYKAYYNGTTFVECNIWYIVQAILYNISNFNEPKSFKHILSD
ncbi:uncharacterized protein LOC126906314 isoform X2 [Daktulosphaira vitifoliae]|uniref:uncharacterized protein LOC126906314 isoform X2 n=1 Tax=Daktulosphaira vitifoliae TaxID=58002 RepID=UPI0021AA0D54|nr:uncharacterized protein LOC126906314 isoform X2 [Daktulosphaira vitifoliae]